MALGTPTYLTGSYVVAPNDDRVVSGSVTPTAGAVIYAHVQRVDFTIPEDPGFVSGTGWASGLTWTLIGRAGTDYQSSVFRATVPASPTAGTVAFGSPGVTQAAYAIELVEITDAVEAPVATGTSAHSGTTSISATVSGTPSASNMLMSFTLHSVTGSTWTPGSGYTGIRDSGGTFSQYDASAPSDGVVDATASSSGSGGTVAWEIEEVAGGGGGGLPIPVAMHYYRQLRNR